MKDNTHPHNSRMSHKARKWTQEVQHVAVLQVQNQIKASCKLPMSPIKGLKNKLQLKLCPTGGDTFKFVLIGTVAENATSL